MTTTPTPDQNPELQTMFTEFKGGWSQIKDLPATVKTLQDENTRLTQQLTDLRRLSLSRSAGWPSPRTPGRVSDECAQHIMAQFISQCQKSNRLEALCSVNSERGALIDFARQNLDLTTRAALSTAEVPLPTHFAGEIRELISQFGVVRKHMSTYPIGMGTAKPARMGTRNTFGSVAMSAILPDKAPTITFASLESHKIGGLVRLPREIDEQSIVPMGQFLARYGAIEFARAEDQWGFLADGGISYDNSVRGIVQAAKDLNQTVTLAAGKTKPSDATLADFRNLRLKVNKAALSGRLSAYYLDSTWEAALPGFKTSAEPNVYQRLPDGTAILDGYPIVWTDVLGSYSTTATINTPLAVFGALSFWWFGEHGHPRIDTSDHVLFVNDQLAVKFIEEIDFDYAASDATAALLTPSS